MKKFSVNMVSLAAAVIMLVAFAGIASGVSTDENKLNAEIAMLNAEVNLPQGDMILSKQLTDSFSIGTDKLSSLLGMDMQYGDIAAVLAFAEKMPGGVNDVNISKVVDMRNQGNWDQLSKSLNVSMSDVVSKLSNIEDNVHKNIKFAYAESLGTGEAAGGVEPSDEFQGVPSDQMTGEGTGGLDAEGDVTGETEAEGDMTGEGAGGTSPSEDWGSAGPGGSDSGSIGGHGDGY